MIEFEANILMQVDRYMVGFQVLFTNLHFAGGIWMQFLPNIVLQEQDYFICSKQILLCHVPGVCTKSRNIKERSNASCSIIKVEAIKIENDTSSNQIADIFTEPLSTKSFRD